MLPFLLYNRSLKVNPENCRLGRLKGIHTPTKGYPKKTNLWRSDPLSVSWERLCGVKSVLWIFWMGWFYYSWMNWIWPLEYLDWCPLTAMQGFLPVHSWLSTAGPDMLSTVQVPHAQYWHILAAALHIISMSHSPWVLLYKGMSCPLSFEQPYGVLLYTALNHKRFMLWPDVYMYCMCAFTCALIHLQHAMLV